MSFRSFLNDRVTLYPGDCRTVLATLPEASVDSVVCDPPYHLTSIVKRFGGENAAPAKVGKTGAYARASAGFMGKQWDGGDVAFQVETWAAVFRVMKPGGHLLAFSGTRTYHRMVCAIEDAGFEIRDCIFWHYGSGFPKSHDVSKAIDRRRDWEALPRLQSAIKLARSGLGISQSEAARRMGLIGPDEELGGGGFMWFETGMRMPTREQWPRLKECLGIGDAFDLCFEEAEREITGTAEEWTDRTNYAITSKDGFRRDKPATEAAKQWEGWGTALKPATEPIVLARKPLAGTVAENVLRYGTGGLNIDGCRIAPIGPGDYDHPGNDLEHTRKRRPDWRMPDQQAKPNDAGRWPANLVHDGSPEVLAAFPDESKSGGNVLSPPSPKTAGIYGDYSRDGQRFHGHADNGSAARFFYTAKADADDRLGSKHPTVKPLDLMQWLVRLVTPRNGVCLDPFAGTGTTGEAAWREGMRAILIEREPEYIADIERRMDLAANPTKRSAVAKTKNQLDDPNSLPLFRTESAAS